MFYGLLFFYCSYDALYMGYYIIIIVSHISAIIISLSALSQASQGDVGHAVGLLTTQPAEVQDPGETQKPGIPEEVWEGQKGTAEGPTGTHCVQFHTEKKMQLHYC